MAVQGEFVIIIVADNGTGVSDDRMRLLQQKLRDNNGYDEGGSRKPKELDSAMSFNASRLTSVLNQVWP